MLRQEDWATAETTLQACDATWQQAAPIWRILIDHQDMQDLELAFIDLHTAIRQQDAQEVERELAALRFYLAHVPDSERVDWGNLL